MTDSSLAALRSFTLGSSRSLDIAARSLFESEATHGSVESVVAEGALSHHWSGLFQYAAIRVGAEAAGELLAQLVSWFETEFQLSLGTERSGRPAHALYRALQGLLRSVPENLLEAGAKEWWVPAEERLALCVIRLRRGLAKAEWDVLELCYCRGLTPDESADVLGRPRSEVEAALAVGIRLTEDLIRAEDRRQGVTRDRLLLQAFALDPRRVNAPLRPSREPVLKPGAIIQERYEIEGLLGAGAFADVYRARDCDVTGHVVALKILRRQAVEPQAVRAALRELQLIASVFHPSVVQLKDHGWFDSRLWFVMPLYRGETLASRLQRGPLSRQEARRTFEVLAEALAAMHRAGVRHQDIKPENVFLANIGPEEKVDSRVLPVLLDLGVAAKDVELVLAGTPAYFAPEVAARFCGMPDPPAVGPPADVFSLTLTLRDALDPIPRDYFAAGAVDAFVSFRARNSPRPPWREDLRDLAPSFERWLHRQPDVRPSAEQFREELSVLTRPEERRRRRASLLRWLLPSVVALLTLFVSVVYVLAKEADLRRSEAETASVRATRAFERAENMHASLEAEEALRRRLQAEVASLEAEYRSSRFTRAQLASRLAKIEGEARLSEEQHTRETRRLQRKYDKVEALRVGQEAKLESLVSLERRRDELHQEVAHARRLLEEERVLRSELETKNLLLEAQVGATRDAINATRQRIDVLLKTSDDDAPLPPPD